MRLANLMLVAASLTVAGCSASNSAAPNTSTPRPAWKICNITGDNYNLLEILQASAKG